jgi:hypothetical protein
MVFGGINYLNVPIQTIELYDMTLRPASWESLPGWNMEKILGTLILSFDVHFCDAMVFQAIGDLMFICSGNYTWKSFKPVGYLPFTITKFAVVDASMFGGTNVW